MKYIAYMDVVKTVEDRNVAYDDQLLAEIEAKITQAEQKRCVINAKLRRLRLAKTELMERRVLTDCAV